VRIRTATNRAAAFTLVELMVSMALIVLIMSILAQAFAESGALFRESKGLGDMNENLRTAVVRLRDDLLQRHFEGSKKLSTGYRDGSRPGEGFFRIQQGAPHLVEGVDPDGLPSYRVTADILHMSIAQTGERREHFFTAAPIGVPPPQAGPAWLEGPPDYRSNTAAGEFFMNSQRAEIMWFLAPMLDPVLGTQMTAGAGATPLFSLHRRTRLLVVDNNAAINGAGVPTASLGQFPEFAARPSPANANVLHFPSMTDLANPAMRSMMDPTGTASAPSLLPGTMSGEDRVIADVISFEIKVLRYGDPNFLEVRAIHPTGAGVYDTATWPGPQVTLAAIQVIIRVFDAKTDQSRQITMIQDL
jgi:hypothetical protein